MYAVTGVTGKLGPLIVSALERRGVPTSRLIGLARAPSKAAALADRGVAVREADYDRPETLEPALAGVETLVFVSASEIGRRVPQHAAVIEAAKAAGVKLIAYTSLLRADSSAIGLAAEHRETEKLLAASGVPHLLLRNGWYLENYTENLGPDLEHGVHLGSAGEGKVSAASRADYAEAAAVVATTPGHVGETYELAGDSAFTMTELAAKVAETSGVKVDYRDLPPSEHVAALVQAGVPQGFAELLADWDAGVKRGDLYSDSRKLRELIGRDTTTLAQAVAEAV